MDFSAPWLLPAIASCLLSGLVAFTSKVAAERKLDSAMLNVYGFACQFICATVAWGFLGTYRIDLESATISTVAAFCVYWNYKSRTDALRHMDSSVFFMNYRIISSMLLIVIGMFVFQEQITASNLFGVFLGFLVFFFLTESADTTKERDVLKGVPFLVISALCIVILNTMLKRLTYLEANVYDYLFVLSSVGLTLSVCLNWKKLRSAHILHNPGNIIGMGFLQGVLLIVSTVTIQAAYAAGGDLVIVYKMVSYSLFLPILLSIWIYGEKMTKRRWIAAGIMVVSLYFLV